MKVTIRDLKATIRDMKSRMDEKDDFTEGLQADADALRHDPQKEINARREDIDALRGSSISLVSYSH
jgi:Sec-independent protein translocase protein TatA